MKSLSASSMCILLVLFVPAAALHGQIVFPAGTEDFEAMTVGDDVTTLTNWVVVNTSAPASLFTVTAADDVLGSVTPRNGSTRWLRVEDQDAGPVENRFYSPTLVAPGDYDYTWTWYVNLETTPPGAGATARPRFTIQHIDGGFANAWGIEFSDTGASLIITGIGGPPASTPLYSLASPTGVGDWVKLELSVDFLNNEVSARANDGAPVSLPFSLSPTADKSTFRFCYRGEGADNVVTMLVDDVSVQSTPPIPAVSEWGLLVASLLMLTAGTILFMRRREGSAPDGVMA